MINPEILREYDIRGIYEKSLTLNDIIEIGEKLSKIIHSKNSNMIIIGHDGRNSSLKIKNSLIKTFLKFGIDVVDISLIPTPISYFANKTFNIPNVIMITGSHNPKDYNGLKIIIDNKPFFSKNIKSLNKIDTSNLNYPKGVLSFKNSIYPYIENVLINFKNINNLKIVWDPGNGAIGPIINDIVKIIGGQNIILNKSIDGNFPNHHPDPTIKKNISQVSEYIQKNKFDLGIAFDGDGDRVGIIDNKGNLVYSDLVFLLLALDLQKDKKDLVAVADVKCSKVLFDTLKENGIKILMSKTGHSLIKEMITRENADIAGEMSGHIFYKYKYYGYDDAIYASLKLIKIINDEKSKLSDLIEPYIKSSSTPEIKLYCDESMKFNLLNEIITKLKKSYQKDTLIDIDGIRIESEDFWFLIRASNTQNCLVFRLEHFKKKQFKEELENLISIFNKFDLDISELNSFHNAI